MNEIQLFENPNFGSIRTMNVDGKTWFVGSDVAKALGYAKPANAIAQHCRCTLKQGIPHPQGNGTLMVNIISEGDLYRLVAHSELPSAEKFESWVFDEVLPTIRRTGQYSVKLDPSKDMRAEAMLNNSQTRKAKLFYEIAKNTSNELYRQAGEALAMNLLAGKEVVSLPVAEQRANHELGYFCQFIGQKATWATTLGKKLKRQE
jgi:prophage antirepressor-like protein